MRTRNGTLCVKMKKPGPILFSCSGCGAEYKIVIIEFPNSNRGPSNFVRVCDTPFPATEGDVLLEYVVVKRPR